MSKMTTQAQDFFFAAFTSRYLAQKGHIFVNLLTKILLTGCSFIGFTLKYVGAINNTLLRAYTAGGRKRTGFKYNYVGMCTDYLYG